MTHLTDLFKGLLSLDGHLVDDAIVRPVAAVRSPTRAGGTFSVLQHLQLLGGRPMHAGHNFASNEPFELTAANDAPALRDCAACG